MKISKYNSNFTDSGDKLLVILYQNNHWYLTITFKKYPGRGLSMTFRDTRIGRDQMVNYLVENFREDYYVF